jgi:drug/metabolite transporter (DMT)-like permease
MPNRVMPQLRTALVSGVLMVLPFLVLQLVNRWTLDEGFPVFLFVFLWGLSTIIAFTLIPIVWQFRVRAPRSARPWGFAIRLALLVIVAGLWLQAVADQMPCFLGVPNCD